MTMTEFNKDIKRGSTLEGIASDEKLELTPRKICASRKSKRQDPRKRGQKSVMKY